MQTRRTSLDMVIHQVNYWMEDKSEEDWMLYYQHQWTWRPGQKWEDRPIPHVEYTKGMPCYTRQFGHIKEPKWIPEMVAEVQGPRSVKITNSNDHQMELYRKSHVDQFQRIFSTGGDDIPKKKNSPGSTKVLSAKRSPRLQSNLLIDLLQTRNL